MAETEALFVIDGYNIIFRSYFAFAANPLRNDKGENTSAIFGFFRTIAALIRKHRPTELCVVLDPIGPTFRHQRYPAYKGTREKTPDDLKSQFPRIEAITEKLGLPIVRVEGYEADDAIASIVRTYAKKSTRCVIVSADKDLMQLITENVTMLQPIRQGFEHIDRERVLEKKGVRADQIGDYVALLGDVSDNIPGVTGIGQKTAAKLLGEYETLANIYNEIATIPAAQAKKLTAGHQSALLSRELVTLIDNLDIAIPAGGYPLALTIEPAAPLLRAENSNSLIAEYRQLTGTLPAEQNSTRIDPTPEADGHQRAESDVTAYADQYEMITTTKKLEEWMRIIRTERLCAFDTETTALDPMRAEPVGLSFAVGNHRACYIPLTGPDGVVMDNETVRAHVKPILEDVGIRIVGQNIKYDMNVMAQWGVSLNGIIHDTMIAAWLIDTTSYSYKLDTLAQKYLHYRTIPYPEEAKKAGFASIALPQATLYAAEDADITYTLYAVFDRMLKAQPKLYALYNETEMALLPILSQMEMTGIKVDTGRLRTLKEQLSGELETLKHDVYQLSGEEFNINSTQALQKILFTKLQLTPIKKTKTGYSTDMGVLNLLAKQHPLPEKIVEYRIVAKLLSTYIETLPQLIHPHSGRIHTTFNIIGTATGRISSTDPNLQNIPIKGEHGRKIRTAFVANPECQFVSADYSQIELVIFAHLSQDPALLVAFRENTDIHALTAATVFGCASSDVTAEQRRMAKVINFGVMYGMSAFRLARELSISQTDAKLFIEQYFAKYASVRQYIDTTIAKARKTGYVYTLLGRRRPVPDITNQNNVVRQAAERIAINTPIQGSAADIIKLAMKRVHAAFTTQRLQSKLLLQVHDELVVEALTREREQVVDILSREMSGAYRLSIPLRVHINSGSDWGVLK